MEARTRAAAVFRRYLRSEKYLWTWRWSFKSLSLVDVGGAPLSAPDCQSDPLRRISIGPYPDEISDSSGVELEIERRSWKSRTHILNASISSMPSWSLKVFASSFNSAIGIRESEVMLMAAVFVSKDRLLASFWGGKAL